MQTRPLERRRPGRPKNGDAKPCPKCVEATCEFSERYRFDDVGLAPAWICESPHCRYRDLVRRAHRRAAGESPAAG
jgi:hypothetical protein